MEFLDEIDKYIEELNRKTDEIFKETPLENLLTDQFIQNHSNFKTMYEFFEASNFDVSSQEAFESIPDEEIDDFVQSTTDFDSWQELLNEAASIYLQKVLNS